MRPQNQLLTTGDVARWCHVTTNAVKKWIREKNLPAFKTPGGHYRIRVEDFEEFLKRYRMPMAEALREQRVPKVLVVDDDPQTLDVVVSALADPSMGLAVASATDGYDALIAIGHLKPDILILDLKMPRVDGLAVCRQLQANPNTRDVSVMVLTGFPTKQNLKKSREMGVEAILTKPVRLDELIGTVRRILERKGMPSAKLSPA